MEHLKLATVKETVNIKGVLFPKEVNVRKLIITGPPGSGKTSILTAIGGWPEEGYLDITSPGWWKSPNLEPKPRELHFGVPFVGYEKAVPVYDIQSLDNSNYLELDFIRIPLPPPPSSPLSPNFRAKMVIEFILLPPKTLFAMRKKRALKRTHHVDENLTLNQIIEESAFYNALALFFHQSGMNVYVRDDLNAPPKWIRDDTEAADPVAMARGKGAFLKAFYERHDQLKLRQRILNRSWSFRGNRELLTLFISLLPSATNSERCNIFINDSTKKGEWLLSGTHLNTEQVVVSRMQVLVDEVIASGEYMVHEAMDQEKSEKNTSLSSSDFVLRNTLLVPIKSLMRDQTIGVIQLLNKKKKGYFEEEDRLLLEKVALHLQLAMENIYLRKEMMDFSEVLSDRTGKLTALSFFWVPVMVVLLILSIGFNIYTFLPEIQTWLAFGPP